MKILVTGGTGFIGKHLSVELLKNGHELSLVTRKKPLEMDLPLEFVVWDMENNPPPRDLDPNEYGAVIHLAGENISGGRWTEARKKRILESRTKTTEALGRWLANRKEQIPVVISASAIGYYGDRPGEKLEENSAKGQGFLAEVCEAWERSVKTLSAKRETRLRFGVVIGQGGGFLKPLRLMTNFALGGIVGGGEQRMSFVHRSDIIQVIVNALHDERYQGAINLVAPKSATQKEFQRTLSRLMHRPTLVHIPAFIPKLAIGEMAALVLDSQDVAPHRLGELSYKFIYPDLESALSEALDLREKNGKLYPCHRLEKFQFVARPREEVYPFFSAPTNLEQITPPMMSFHIENMSSKDIAEGTIINYKLKVHGVPMRWRTRITDWQMPEMFSDNQEKGPYSIWFHTHKFHAVKQGTLMCDTVRYRLPFGALGDLFALPLVKRDVSEIFGYRKQMIDKEFPGIYDRSHAPS